jgi:hypothetical protein
MTQTSLLHPRQHSLLECARRPKMLIAGGAIVVATLLATAMLLSRAQAMGITDMSSPLASAAVSAPASALSVPAAEKADATSDRAISAQTRDDWYADQAISAPPIARHVVDTWYLENPAMAAPVIARHVADRWYLDDSAVSPAPPLSTQSKDTWYLDR